MMATRVIHLTEAAPCLPGYPQGAPWEAGRGNKVYCVGTPPAALGQVIFTWCMLVSRAKVQGWPLIVVVPVQPLTIVPLTAQSNCVVPGGFCVPFATPLIVPLIATQLASV